MSVQDEIPAAFLSHVSPAGLAAIQKCKDFVDHDCLPADELFLSQIPTDGRRWKQTPAIVDKLQARAKQLGLWNMFLSKHYAEGAGYTNLEYGLMARYLGRSLTAPSATNTAAPDTGNMEILARFGTPAQKERWLAPLLDGTTRSAFLMTEKGTSLSNALNIATSATRNARGNYVLNGVKWFASGAGDPRCVVWLVMCKTDSDAKKPYRNHTVLVIDARKAVASGRATVVRPLTVFGFDDAPHGHCEVVFDNYEVDDMKECVLGTVGSGFEVIQSRLGPGRIHHCMRLVGVAEYAMMVVAHRASNRHILGQLMKDRETFLAAYAQHRIDIERCLLLVLNAAHKIDVAGHAKAAMREIAMAKIETPRTVLSILDWGIQMFGAEGVSQDTVLARLYANSRTLRIADGPDEAHLNQLGRAEARKFPRVEEYFRQQAADTERVAKM